MFRALQGAAGHNRAVYWPGQVLYVGPVLTPVWVAGAIWSLRSAAARRFRPVAIGCVVAIYLASGLRSSWTQAWPAFRDYS
ncbi:MAG TPA: hypothetical protein VED20_12150 [Streptosporangiaceae bacterium]|nr:hypothetical protein [Streptosporangiaceae bacterium]